MSVGNGSRIRYHGFQDFMYVSFLEVNFQIKRMHKCSKSLSKALLLLIRYSYISARHMLCSAQFRLYTYAILRLRWCCRPWLSATQVITLTMKNQAIVSIASLPNTYNNQPHGRQKGPLTSKGTDRTVSSCGFKNKLKFMVLSCLTF